MTAEIAIMNREAIALASDSAVTSRTGSGHKIFTSANKLFALSQYHPVGVMVYGNASFMDAPWELIIKTYRKQLGEEEFASIEEYVADLISFISNDNPLFPEDVQEKYYRGVVGSYFAIMRNQVREKIKAVIDKNGSITDRGVRQTVSQVIGE